MEKLLPIFPEHPNSRPKSSTLDPSEIRNYLNEQVRLTRLANSTVNKPNSKIYLEPITPELFNVFKDEQQDTPMEDANLIVDGTIKLMPVGSLKTKGEKQESPTTPLVTLNVADYQAKRRKLAEENKLKRQQQQQQQRQIQAQQQQVPPQQRPMVQQLQQRLQQQQQKSIPLTNGNHLATTRPTQAAPVPITVPSRTPTPVQTPSQVTTQPLTQASTQAPLTQVSIQAPVHVTTQPPVQVRPVQTPVQSTSAQLHTQAPKPVQPPAQVHTQVSTQASTQVHTQVSTQTSVQSKPVEAPVQSNDPIPPVTISLESTPASSPQQPADSSSPGETMHTAPSSPVQIADDTDITTLYNPNKIDTTLSKPDAKKIYAYPPHLIPIFITPTQQSKLDSISQSANARSPMFFSVNFDKSLETLNLLDDNVELKEVHEWERSGKTMFLKLLLDQLKDQDKTLVVLTATFDEESLLYSWFKSTLKLRSTRVTNILDSSWDGEHGVIVRTKQNAPETKFKTEADAILCLDIRARGYMNAIRQFQSNPPIVCLVALGSIESRCFQYLKEKNMVYSDKCTTDEFKKLFNHENQWPNQMGGRSVMGLNQLVASNFSAWLVRVNEKHEYQFRDTIELPQSYHFANIKSDVEDMEVSDDEPVTITAVPKTLAPQLTKYIEEQMFPKCELVQLPPNDIPAFLKGGDHEGTVTSLVEEYSEQVEKLRAAFDGTAQKLQQRFQDRAKEAFLKK